MPKELAEIFDNIQVGDIEEISADHHWEEMTKELKRLMFDRITANADQKLTQDLAVGMDYMYQKGVSAILDKYKKVLIPETKEEETSDEGTATDSSESE